MAKDKKSVEAPEEPQAVEDVVAENNKAVVHEEEVAAIRDSRKRDLPLFKATIEGCDSWGFLWIVAVSEHQAKLALIDRVWPMEKCSKKDRDYRYLHLLESAAVDAHKPTA